MTTIRESGVVVEIGRLPIFLRTGSSDFRAMLEDRYQGFVVSDALPEFRLDIELHEPGSEANADADVEVLRHNGNWILRRGDFSAVWETKARCGQVVQSPNPYAIDSVLRIVHTLLLASRGGFLLHAASVIRHGQAFLFAGVSGAGKTTIARLAPADVTLLSDEVSYIRRDGENYQACGTPFTGELAKAGENVAAPVAAVFFLQKGPDHSVEPIQPSEAVRTLMRNILFFAQDQELVNLVFQSACGFLDAVPAYRLIFAPQQQVWDLIA